MGQWPLPLHRNNTWRAVVGRCPGRLAGLLAWGLGLLLLVAWPAQAARHALVIGNDSYNSITKLRNARADAEAVAAALGSPALGAARYEVMLRTDRNLRQMQADLREFRSRLREKDEVVIFFSGHGVQLGGMNYLLPVDVGSGSEEQVKDESIALGKLLQDLRTHKPALTLAIIDACRDNPFEGTGRNFGTRGLTGVAGASGQMVVYAAGEGQKALDRLSPGDPVRNGLFTRVFLSEVARPGVPIREVLYRVRDQVATLAEGVRHEQVPAVYDQVRGTFYFVPSSAAASPQQVATVVPQRVQAPAPQPEPVRPAPGSAAPVAGQVLKDCEACPELVVVSGGSFTMGSPGDEPERSSDEGPQRLVTVGAFAAGRYEVTFGQWDGCVAAGGCSHRPDDRGWGRGNRPVMDVSWEDAQQYVKWLSVKTGKAYRLLSEAEWEYAARAGTTTAFSTGRTITSGQANFDGNYTYNGSGKGEYRQKTVPVGEFAPNAFGLYDMHGNVWEWVEDLWHDSYVGAPMDGRAWMEGGDQARRVLRGGSWYGDPGGLRAAYRYRNAPDSRNVNIGFRVVRTL